MERYRMLVTGKNDLIIDDIFAHLYEQFDVMCCSYRYEDRLKHIELFDPALFVICLNDESAGEMAKYGELKRRLVSKGIATVVIGKDEECELMEKSAPQLADLILKRPIVAEVIREAIVKEMVRREREKEEQAEILKKLEEVRRQQEKKHILVIDDDPLMLKLIKEYLGEKYVVATAISGKIAHKFLETRDTNLILLDYEMPEENGVEVLLKIREDERLALIPVVFLTGITEREKIVQTLALKPQGYLMKPVDKEKLMGTIEMLIG